MSESPREVCNPAWWTQRLKDASPLDPRQSLWSGCCDSKWEEVEERERGTLARYIRPADRVVDIGCGYGRLLDLMPERWYGYYLGIDNCPEMLRIARERHSSQYFLIWDIRCLPFKVTHFDVALVSSVRGMVINDLGMETWDNIEERIRRIANRVLYMEYSDA